MKTGRPKSVTREADFRKLIWTAYGPAPLSKGEFLSLERKGNGIVRKVNLRRFLELGLPPHPPPERTGSFDKREYNRVYWLKNRERLLPTMKERKREIYRAVRETAEREAQRRDPKVKTRKTGVTTEAQKEYFRRYYRTRKEALKIKRMSEP